MELFVEKSEDILKVKISGTVESSGMKELVDLVNGVCDNPESDIEIDMEEVDYIDSSGIGQFLKMSKVLREKGFSFYIVGASERVKSLLSLCSLQSALVR